MNGTQNQVDPTVCDCEPCFNGLSCDVFCSAIGNATCTEGKCYCGFEGWRGDFCEKKGCPGLFNMDCSGRGTCNSATQTCDCNPGWAGRGCHEPACPGTPMCSDHGTCESLATISFCSCDKGWMGRACETKCENGTPQQTADGSFFCQCDDCFSGISCDMECSGRGNCTNNTCDCGFEGWRGATCDTKGCPGWGSDCSGHGSCITALGICYCRPGWSGRGCHIPQCAGGGNCSGHGVCDGVNHDPPVCVFCDSGYMGEGCEQKCINGTVIKSGEGDTCKCDSCHTGVDCGVECNGHGKCNNGKCACDSGWRGSKCETIGCPGQGVDCTNHGVCLLVTQQCDCFNGWKGEGCDIPDCLGVPDCNALGTCYGGVDPPKCVNCTNNTMGPSCEFPCIHGRENPPDSVICECDPCYIGLACDTECSGRGTCREDVNPKRCECDSGWKGPTCETLDCPGEPDCSGRGACVQQGTPPTAVCLCNQGFDGDDCSKLVCPGRPMCSNRGTCTLVGGIPMCVCNHGFDGSSCERCLPQFTGSECDKCITNYIGWAVGCNIYCVHGNGTGQNEDICTCHNDANLGYWNGTSCDRCVFGWGLPSCAVCDDAHVGENCNIDCFSAHAQYRDELDGDWGKHPVAPILNCLYENAHDEVFAWFGYHNKNPHNVYLNVGADNFLTRPFLDIVPGGLKGFVLKTGGADNATDNLVPLPTQDYGQPNKFVPGRHDKAFKVRYEQTDTANN